MAEKRDVGMCCRRGNGERIGLALDLAEAVGKLDEAIKECNKWKLSWGVAQKECSAWMVRFRRSQAEEKALLYEKDRLSKERDEAIKECDELKDALGQEEMRRKESERLRSLGRRQRRYADIKEERDRWRKKCVVTRKVCAELRRGLDVQGALLEASRTNYSSLVSEYKELKTTVENLESRRKQPEKEMVDKDKEKPWIPNKGELFMLSLKERAGTSVVFMRLLNDQPHCPSDSFSTVHLTGPRTGRVSSTRDDCRILIPVVEY